MQHNTLAPNLYIIPPENSLEKVLSYYLFSLHLVVGYVCYWFVWTFRKLYKIKSEPREQIGGQSSGKQKYAQKFCEKWLKFFSPWLARCDDDPNKPFCRACQCRLDCNRCHLQRHEKTSKHARNLEILVNKGEGAAKQNLSIRQERSKYYKQRRDPEYQDESDGALEDDEFMDE